MSAIRHVLERTPDGICLIQGQYSTTSQQILHLADSLLSKLRQHSASTVLSFASDVRLLIALIIADEQYRLRLVLGRDTSARAQAEACLPLHAILLPDGSWEWVSQGEPPVPEQSGVFLFTSGTTGKPKLVHHYWKALLEGVINRSLDKNQGARWLVPYQPHSFAALQVILSALLSSGTLVFPEHGDFKAYVQAVADHAITHISATPTFWRAFLLAAAGQEFPSLQQVTLGGEAVDQATLDRLRTTFPHARVSHIYASSEAGTLFSVHDGRAGFPAEWLDQEIRGSIHLRIRNGGLEVLTPRRMRSYASGQPPPLLEDGWLITGDLVERRGDRVVFCGRTDRIINVGGLKVSPDEVEDFLLSHPSVREAKVYSIPSPLAGQIVGAQVIADPGSDVESVLSELRTYCARHLPPHKRPRSLSCVLHIAMAESGKKA
jgi:acyl-coenzyme A synthetase/AMP-(fatty) acid ligase